MLNVLAMSDEQVVAAYVEAVRVATLSGATVRWVNSRDQKQVWVRVWNGTQGFTTSVWMDRWKLDTFTVEKVAKSLLTAITTKFRAVYMLDHGATGNYDNPLGGRDPSEWGDVGIGEGEAPAVKAREIDEAIRQTIKNAVHGEQASSVSAALAALPELRALAEEVHRRCLAHMPTARRNYCKDQLREMVTFLTRLDEEGMSKEDILSAVATMLDVVQKNRQPPVDTPAAVMGMLEERVQTWKSQVEKDRDRLMDRLRRELAEGAFRPEEWAWCFKPDCNGNLRVGQLADGEVARLPLRPEDVAFVREHLSPLEVDDMTLDRLVDGGG